MGQKSESCTASTYHMRPASLADIPALVPIFSASFHPVSPFMRKAIPPTQLISSWWRDVHIQALNDPDVRLVTVVSTAGETGEGEKGPVAFARWRLPERNVKAELDAGSWKRTLLTRDHDRQLCGAFIGLMDEYRNKMMRGRPHYFLECVAVAHDHKGHGIGKMLVGWGCEQADQDGVEIFVEANRDALSLYEKFGFELQREVEMPGGMGYHEYILVRPRVGSK